MFYRVTVAEAIASFVLDKVSFSLVFHGVMVAGVTAALVFGKVLVRDGHVAGILATPLVALAS